jgi:hypothetical protein
MQLLQALLKVKQQMLTKIKNRLRFSIIVGALASLVAGLTPALAAAPQHQDQAPGYFRLKVGDFEVTALFDGGGEIGPQLLVGNKTLE